AHQTGDRAETERLIRQYLRIDSTSVVAEAVGIADTLILGSAADQLALLNHVCGHSFLALQYLAFQAAAFGTKAQREGPARAVLSCLTQRGAGDQERVRALRMGLAADLAAGWVDSARHRLAGVGGEWAERERDLWLLTAHDAGLPALGDWERAAAQLSARPRAVQDTDVTAHWALARAGGGRSRRGWVTRTRSPSRKSRGSAGRPRRAEAPRLLRRLRLSCSRDVERPHHTRMIRRPEARGRAITRPVAHDLAMHGHGTIRQVAREDEVDALVERLLRIEEIGSLAAREARRLAVRCLPAIREPRPEH